MLGPSIRLGVVVVVIVKQCRVTALSGLTLQPMTTITQRQAFQFDLRTEEGVKLADDSVC